MTERRNRSKGRGSPILSSRERGAVFVGSMILAMFLPVSPLAPALAEDTPLTLGDLEAYRLALAAKPDPSAPRVGFRDLWERPEAYVNHSVRIEGRVERLFRQPALGEFPPLVEAWVFSEAGDPFCLVFPARSGRPVPEIKAPIRFTGTFLKRLRYQGDVARVAPLIVGPEPPSMVASDGSSWSKVDWVMGLFAASMVTMVIARRHLSRPASRPVPLDPPPVFVDGEADPIEGEPDAGGAADDQPR